MGDLARVNGDWAGVDGPVVNQEGVEDVAERLRILRHWAVAVRDYSLGGLAAEAADEIDRLRAENDRLRDLWARRQAQRKQAQ